MIIQKKNSDITQVTSGIVAHGVNCQGRMGAGVALAIRNRWPAVYEAYLRNQSGYTGDRAVTHLLGSAHIIRVDADLWVANCYTQGYFGKPGTGKYASTDAVRQSLDFAFSHAAALNLPIHAPRIGCSLGGLNWDEEVYDIFDDLNIAYDVDVIIHTL
jgi:O-acetyl-ADP-ribose deacetylase (regulator of RNase III)